VDAAGFGACPTLAGASPDKLALEFGKAAEHSAQAVQFG
jgi:hypothetical protein